MLQADLSVPSDPVNKGLPKPIMGFGAALDCASMRKACRLATDGRTELVCQGGVYTKSITCKTACTITNRPGRPIDCR